MEAAGIAPASPDAGARSKFVTNRFGTKTGTSIAMIWFTR